MGLPGRGSSSPAPPQSIPAQTAPAVPSQGSGITALLLKSRLHPRRAQPMTSALARRAFLPPQGSEVIKPSQTPLGAALSQQTSVGATGMATTATESAMDEESFAQVRRDCHPGFGVGRGFVLSVPGWGLCWVKHKGVAGGSWGVRGSGND